jgi:hypothetical protein
MFNGESISCVLKATAKGDDVCKDGGTELRFGRSDRKFLAVFLNDREILGFVRDGDIL